MNRFLTTGLSALMLASLTLVGQGDEVNDQDRPETDDFSQNDENLPPDLDSDEKLTRHVHAMQKLSYKINALGRYEVLREAMEDTTIPDSVSVFKIDVCEVTDDQRKAEKYSDFSAAVAITVGNNILSIPARFNNEAGNGKLMPRLEELGLLPAVKSMKDIAQSNWKQAKKCNQRAERLRNTLWV